jgi:hypothetical protein
VLAYLLLGVTQIVGLLLIPLGGPGIWLQIGALALFAWWTEFAAIGAVPLVVLLLVVMTAEVVEAPLAAGGRRFQGRRRAGLAGLAGGVVGAILGFRFPLLGSVFGAVAGALTGTLIAAVSARSPGVTFWALLGQAGALAIKTAAGVIVALFALMAALG